MGLRAGRLDRADNRRPAAFRRSQGRGRGLRGARRAACQAAYSRIRMRAVSMCDAEVSTGIVSMRRGKPARSGRSYTRMSWRVSPYAASGSAGSCLQRYSRWRDALSREDGAVVGRLIRHPAPHGTAGLRFLSGVRETVPPPLSGFGGVLGTPTSESLQKPGWLNVHFLRSVQTTSSNNGA